MFRNKAVSFFYFFSVAHPNKDQFNQYLQQWQTYEKQMEEKKADIQRRKEEAKKQIKTQEKAAAKGQPFPGAPPPGMMGMGPRPGFGGPPPGGPPPFGAPPPPGGPPGMRHRPPMGQMHPGGPRGQFGGPGAPGPVSGAPPTSGFQGAPPRGPPGRGQPNEDSGSRPVDNMGRGRGQSWGARGRGRGGMNEFGHGGKSDNQEKDNEMYTEDDVNDVSEKTVQRLFDDLMNSDDPKVNKMMLKQINEDGKEMLTKLELAATVFIKNYVNMNPAQLNKMVKVVNNIGDESVMLKKKGIMTPTIISRMKNEMLDEIRRFGISVPDLGPGRPMHGGKGEPDMGRGRGGPQRGGMQFSRGRGRGNFQGNRFDYSKEFEEESQDMGRNNRFGNDGANKGGPDKKGPVSLFDLEFNEPPPMKKPGKGGDTEKSNQGQFNKDEMEGSQSFNQG